MATKAVGEILRIHDKEIKKWLGESERDSLVLNIYHSFAVEKTVLRSDIRVHEDIHNTITVLAKDPVSLFLKSCNLLLYVDNL